MTTEDELLTRLRGIAAARDDEGAAILAATDAGIPQKAIADALGKERDYVRRAVRRLRPWTRQAAHAEPSD